MRGSEINDDLAAALWAVRAKHAVTHGEVDGIATHRLLEIAITPIMPIPCSSLAHLLNCNVHARADTVG